MDAPKIEDESCGLFPCYNAVIDGRQKVSSSVGSLIKELGGGLKEDINFNPNYNGINYDGSTYCWKDLTTIDTRIKRVKAFEGVSFIPKKEAMTKDTFLDLSVKYLKEWVSEIETKFPNRVKIVLTGGRDSRIVHLIPKRNPSLWYIFSSFPDAPLLKNWLDINKIPHNKFFNHKGFSDDTEDILTAKIVASDFMVRPDDLRFAGKILEIAKKFDNKCLFITGMAGDTLYACRDDLLSRNNYRNYFDVQYRMLAGLQGSVHQMIFNLTNCPTISIYAAPKLWLNVYQRFNPSVFKGQDLRPELGNRVAGRKLEWLKEDNNHLCVPHWKNTYTITELRQRYVNNIIK